MLKLYKTSLGSSEMIISILFQHSLLLIVFNKREFVMKFSLTLQVKALREYFRSQDVYQLNILETFLE